MTRCVIGERGDRDNGNGWGLENKDRAHGGGRAPGSGGRIDHDLFLRGDAEDGQQGGGKLAMVLDRQLAESLLDIFIRGAAW